jgi:hypothetical protein
MPAPIPNEIRRQIVERHEAGEALTTISHDLNQSYNTVRKIWSHWRQHKKLSPNYEQARQKGTRTYAEVYADAIEMKRHHPQWGAQLIRLELQRQYPDAELPAVRTLQTWFKQAGVNRSAKIKRESARGVKRGQSVHEVWAVDAKEQMQLADGSYGCWLTLTDEASGSVLGCETFSPKVLDTNRSDTGASGVSDDV